MEEERGRGEEETEPGRSHSYATRHDESLSFGDPACGPASLGLQTTWPLLYLNAFRTTNVKFCRHPRKQGVKQGRTVHARVIYIMAQLAAVLSLLKRSKGFLRLTFAFIPLVTC